MPVPFSGVLAVAAEVKAGGLLPVGGIIMPPPLPPPPPQADSAEQGGKYQDEAGFAAHDCHPSASIP